jgi:hypothetical protein
MDSDEVFARQFNDEQIARMLQEEENELAR